MELMFVSLVWSHCGIIGSRIGMMECSGEGDHVRIANRNNRMWMMKELREESRFGESGPEGMFC
jgi:hypothetical protein